MNMKRTLLATVLLSSMAITASAEIVGDTLVIEEAKKVKIETRDTVQRIVISGSKDDSQFQYVQRISIPDTSAVRRTIKSVKDFNKISIPGKDGKTSKWTGSVHFAIGLNTMLNAPDGYDFKVWPSWEFALTFQSDYRPYGKQNVWSIGLGFDWRHYKMNKDKYLYKDAKDYLTPKAFAGASDTYSSLRIYSLNLPLMYTHYFDKKQKWGLTLGAIVNWNFTAYAYCEYSLGNEDYEVKTRKIGHQPITVDAMAIAHIPSFPDIYCKYCPMNVFKDDRGPKMHQLSFGFYW